MFSRWLGLGFGKVCVIWQWLQRRRPILYVLLKPHFRGWDFFFCSEDQLNHDWRI